MFSFDDVIMDCIAMYLQAKPIFHHNLRTQIIKKNSKRGHFQAAPCLTKHVFKKKKKKKKIDSMHHGGSHALSFEDYVGI